MQGLETISSALFALSLVAGARDAHAPELCQVHHSTSASRWLPPAMLLFSELPVRLIELEPVAVRSLTPLARVWLVLV